MLWRDPRHLLRRSSPAGDPETGDNRTKGRDDRAPHRKYHLARDRIGFVLAIHHGLKMLMQSWSTSQGRAEAFSGGNDQGRVLLKRLKNRSSLGISARRDPSIDHHPVRGSGGSDCFQIVTSNLSGPLLI
jgi:hypothetical protein